MTIIFKKFPAAALIDGEWVTASKTFPVNDPATGAEIAAVFGEGMPDLADGAIAVVGEAVDHDGDATGAVALVARLLVILAIELARAALDRALDVVLGQALRPGLVDHEAQARIRIEVAAAHAGSDRDLTDELGEYLAPLGVLGALAELDVGPFTVASHAR